MNGLGSADPKIHVDPNSSWSPVCRGILRVEVEHLVVGRPPPFDIYHLLPELNYSGKICHNK